jgi:hypothetical protein
MSKENTNNKNMESTTRPRKAVFMMRAEGQSWEEYKEAFIKALLKKGMLEEEVQTEQSPQQEEPLGWLSNIFRRKTKILLKKTDKGRGGKMQKQNQEEMGSSTHTSLQGSKHITIVQKDRSTGQILNRIGITIPQSPGMKPSTLPKPKESTSVNTETTPQKGSQTSRKAVFMMRAEGQSFEDYANAFAKALLAKAMLTEPEKNLSDKEQLNVPQNEGGIEQQGIKGETDE